MPPVACLYVSPSGMRPPISDIQRHPLAASLIPFDQTVMREARSLKALERHGLVERGENMWLPTARADEALARRRGNHAPDAYDGAWEHTSITGT